MAPQTTRGEHSIHLGRVASLFLVIVLVVAASGCPRMASSGGGGYYGATAARPMAPAPLAKLMVFGGEDHKTYLGCLNCSRYATDSVENSYGLYGSKYAADSIWNHFGEYGSRYSPYGACNPYATDPPVIVDQAGTYYGRLTLNNYHPEIGRGVALHEWLATVVCEE